MESFAWTDLLGYGAAAAVFLSFSMKNMLTLRLIALASNVAFFSYALAEGLAPILILHGLLFPLNLLRLAQMQRVVQQAEDAIEERANFAWLLPLGEKQVLEEGAILFRKGDPADAMFVVGEGEVEIVEYGAVLGRGDLFGEIGLFSRDAKRSATVRARTKATLARISDARVRRLHYDNPGFAYQLTRLIADRLLHDIEMEKAGPDAAHRLSPP